MGMQLLRGCEKNIKQFLHNFYFITIFASILCFGFAVFILDKIGNLFFSNLTEIEIAVFKQNLLTRINGIFIIYAQRFLGGIIH